MTRADQVVIFNLFEEKDALRSIYLVCPGFKSSSNNDKCSLRLSVIATGPVNNTARLQTWLSQLNNDLCKENVYLF